MLSDFIIKQACFISEIVEFDTFDKPQNKVKYAKTAIVDLY